MINPIELMASLPAYQSVAVVLLYSGPDQIMPLLSIIGVVIGFLLMWWRRLTGLVRRTWKNAFNKSAPIAKKAETGANRALADDDQRQPHERKV